MDSKKIFEERNKLYENIDKDENNFSNERIETKLSLRKQKFYEILSKKRLITYNTVITNKEKLSKWKLPYNIKNFEFPKEFLDKHKLNLDKYDPDEIISLSLKLFKSDNIDDIKYSIILL